MEMLVGVGAARVRDLFAQAKKNAPAIIFIDEIDAIGRMRSVGLMGGHDEREQTLNQILVEMDGFEPNTTVLIVAATNRGDLLDPALLRPGRFDRRVVLDLPDMAGRKDILAIHAKGKPFAAAVDWDKVAKRTVGFSGADLENMLNEAAILAARDSKKEIDMVDLEEAATKVKLGPEKKRLQTDLDRKMTAYHEAGHAVVNFYSPNLDPVHRISIVSRGHALGFTMAPPEKDRLHETKSHLIEEIAMTMGGRAAEQLIFDEMTSGAANDIDQATRIARFMVMEFGMSDLGPINFGPQMDITEWGKQFMEQSQISPDMLGKIDAEVKKLVDAGMKKAALLLKQHKADIVKVADMLIKKETIEGEEFEKLMGSSKKRVN
jgi:cell division protease FtsH